MAFLAIPTAVMVQVEEYFGFVDIVGKILQGLLCAYQFLATIPHFGHYRSCGIFLGGFRAGVVTLVFALTLGQ